MRKLGSLAIALAIAPSLVACGEDAPDSSVSGVFPSSAFLGRQARIEISGDVTTWDAPTVSFGEGVTVDAVNVASPTALFVDVTIAPTAAAGLRTVTVTDGGETLELTDAFELEAPVRVRAQGTLAQGSVASLTIENRDFDVPFDTSAIPGEGLFDPPTFVGVTLDVPDGVTLDISDVQPYSISAFALIDVSAGTGGMTLTSGVEVENQVVSPVDGFDIAPRTATAITAATTGMVTAPLSTDLYEYTATGSPSLLRVAISSQNPSASPGVIVLGPSGSFDEILAFNSTVTAPVDGGKFYLISFDNSGAAGYEYTLTPASSMLTVAAEAANNDTAATAQVASVLPFGVVNATLSSANDADWVKITVTAADVGKRLAAATTPGDPQADTILQFFRGDTGTTAFGGESSDQNYHETLVSPVIPAAGTYFVKVTASTFQAPTPATDGYNVFVWIE